MLEEGEWKRRRFGYGGGLEFYEWLFRGTKKSLWWWVGGVWKRKRESEERGLSMSEEDEVFL